MPSKKTPEKKLLVFTSGGDSPGMNATLRAVVRSGHYHGFQVFACHDGYQGLVEKRIFPLHPGDVANCIQRGGTIIRSERSAAFMDKNVRAECREFLAAHNIKYIAAIGGDGTYRGAAIFEDEGGPKCVGMPGTIDNDIVGTEYTIGYDTARNTALQAIDKIRDTAASNNIYFLIETMGRRAGFIAADVGIAGGAEFIITPEFPMSTEELALRINNPARKKQSLIIVVAEGDQPGHSVAIAEKLKELTPGIRYRVCILGHTQRGGSPTAMDRLAGSYMGNMAVEALAAGKSKCMTAMQKGKYVLAPFPDPSLPSRSLADTDIMKLSAVLSI
jgi:6-phosphofructokinase 1